MANEINQNSSLEPANAFKTQSHPGLAHSPIIPRPPHKSCKCWVPLTNLSLQRSRPAMGAIMVAMILIERPKKLRIGPNVCASTRSPSQGLRLSSRRRDHHLSCDAEEAFHCLRFKHQEGFIQQTRQPRPSKMEERLKLSLNSTVIKPSISRSS